MCPLTLDITYKSFKPHRMYIESISLIYNLLSITLYAKEVFQLQNVTFFDVFYGSDNCSMFMHRNNFYLASVVKQM